MGLTDKLLGTSNESFKVGLTGNQIKNDTDGIAIRNTADNALKNAVVARPQGASADTHAATYLDVKQRIVLIEYSFAGSDVGTGINPGDNTGKYGMCHTDGSTYVAGSIYYDTGVALEIIPMYKMMEAASTTAFTGTVSMIANGLYIAQSAGGNYTWTLKGDGSGTSTGVEKFIEVAVTASKGNFDSTTVIPEGARITRVLVDVTTLYDGGATIQVTANGSAPVTLQATTENLPSATGTYGNTPMAVLGATGTGVVRVVLGGGTVTVGAAKVIVGYVAAFLA